MRTSIVISYFRVQVLIVNGYSWKNGMFTLGLGIAGQEQHAMITIIKGSLTVFLIGTETDTYYIFCRPGTTIFLGGGVAQGVLEDGTQVWHGRCPNMSNDCAMVLANKRFKSVKVRPIKAVQPGVEMHGYWSLPSPQAAFARRSVYGYVHTSMLYAPCLSAVQNSEDYIKSLRSRGTKGAPGHTIAIGVREPNHFKSSYCERVNNAYVVYKSHVWSPTIVVFSTFDEPPVNT